MSTSCCGGNLTEAAKLFSRRLDVLAPSDVLESQSEEVAICGNIQCVGCPKRRKFGLHVPLIGHPGDFSWSSDGWIGKVCVPTCFFELR